ncbi:MAG: glycosyl hydrolase [Anaerolineaceae bacterium]|nr:glycosyl hydrolase [Anaerolineaceae bacterium]
MLRSNNIANCRNLVILLILVFTNACSILTPSQAHNLQEDPGIQPSDIIRSTIEKTPQPIFLPVIRKEPAKFFGIYLKQYWNNQNVKTFMPPADKAAGKRHTSVGWFINLEDDAFTIPITNLPNNNLYRQLEELWKAGYISFVNIGSNATANQINNGERDQDISYLAEFYKAWADLGEGRQAMVAPLQEMNGTWTAYGKSSTSGEYKKAYRHIVDIFTQKGVNRNQVLWVFAPNGWNDPNAPERAFENYYPGDDVVDIVGFSSYNYGFCPATAGTSAKWDSFQQIFEPYITRMQLMAPSKLVIIAETATTAYYAYNQSDETRKNQWLIENYQYFAKQAAVIGVYYFSFPEFDGFNCDFEINPKGSYYGGYRNGLADPIYQYLSSKDLNSLVR